MKSETKDLGTDSMFSSSCHDNEGTFSLEVDPEGNPVKESVKSKAANPSFSFLPDKINCYDKQTGRWAAQKKDEGIKKAVFTNHPHPDSQEQLCGYL